MGSIVIVAVEVVVFGTFRFRSCEAFHLAHRAVETLLGEEVRKQFIRLVVALHLAPQYRIAKEEKQLYLIDIPLAAPGELAGDVRLLVLGNAVWAAHDVMLLRPVFLYGVVHVGLVGVHQVDGVRHIAGGHILEERAFRAGGVEDKVAEEVVYTAYEIGLHGWLRFMV